MGESIVVISEFMKRTFDQLVEGVLFIDTEGIVVYANKAYLKFIKMDETDLFGKRLRDVRPHAQLPIVVKEGRRRLHAQRLEDLDEAYFVNMYPILENGHVIGGISIITFMDEAQRARIELDNFEEKNRQLLRKINQLGNQFTFDQVIAEALSSKAVHAYAQKLAEGDMTILLESESGTGKEVYAQAIHNASKRKNNVFLAVNCAGFSKEMMESELFGYEEGAFTGAKKGGKIGLFEAAKGGTLFLDEIADLDFGLQAKLLRALQEHKIRPIGAVREYDVDVRIICACNADLEKRVEEGTFRKDLYYRLNTFPIQIPPLRKRKEDIPFFVDRILTELSEKKRNNLRMSHEALQCLMTYDWPGNVRELRNVVEFSGWLCEGEEIQASDLPQQVRKGIMPEKNSLAERVKQFEQDEINKLLDIYGHTVEGKKKTAQILDISLASLYNKLK